MIGLAAAVGALLIGVGPGQPIGPEAFGQHVAGLATAAPTSLTLTSVRLWDTGVRWDEIEKTRDRYDWATLDAAVANAETAGATDILYVLGSTPRWASHQHRMVVDYQKNVK